MLTSGSFIMIKYYYFLLIAEDLKYDSTFHTDMQKAKRWHGKNEPKINQEYHAKITPAKFNCFYVWVTLILPYLSFLYVALHWWSISICNEMEHNETFLVRGWKAVSFVRCWSNCYNIQWDPGLIHLCRYILDFRVILNDAAGRWLLLQLSSLEWVC